MAKRFFLNDWRVPPPNPSPDTRRAQELRRLREQLPPHVPPIPLKLAEEKGGLADAKGGAGGAPQRSQVVTRRLAALARTQREEGKMRRILGSPAHYTPQEDSDLSLYDDLGVPGTATAEEIRQAHRALARLLHPDRIADEYTRRLAENTLKRINAAFAVLSDAAHREAYDRELAQGGGVVSAVRRGVGLPVAARVEGWIAKRTNAAWLRRNLLWMGGTVAALAIIYWALGTGSPQARTASGPMPVAPIRQAATAKPAPVPRRQAEPVVRAATSAVRETVGEPAREAVGETVRETPRETPRETDAKREKRSVRAPIEAPRAPARHPALIAPPEIQRAEAELLPPPPDFSAQTRPELPPAAQPTLDGLWVYLKPVQAPRNSGSYPPEFIELTLREVNGVLRGRYAARYQVADRPISPDVRFQFEGGVAAATPATFQWTGNGGSRGEVRLSKVGDQQLQVLWFTTQPGPEIGLSSGSATLIRRQAP